MNYPENNQPYGTISRETLEYRSIWKIGISDKATSEDLDLFRQALLLLRFMIEENKATLPAPPRVLFQCSSGYSHGTALAIAYLALTEKTSVDEAYQKVKDVQNDLRMGPLPKIINLLRKEIPQPK